MTAQLNLTWASWLYETTWEDHDKFKQDLLDLIREDAKTLATPVDSGVAVNVKKNMYEPELNFFEKHYNDPRLDSLMSFLDVEIKKTYTALCNSQAMRSWVKDVNVYFKDSWYHITQDRGYHDTHYHGNASFCGIYYLEVGNCDVSDHNGVNRFFSPMHPATEDKDVGYSWWPSDFRDVTPVNGKLVLFPGYLLHNATPYQGDTDRIVIAFNCQIHRNGDTGMSLPSVFANLPILLEEQGNTSI